MTSLGEPPGPKNNLYAQKGSTFIKIYLNK